MFNVYAMRVNLSVAMVAMVNNTMDDTINSSKRSIVECANLITEKQSTDADSFVVSYLGTFMYVFKTNNYLL